MAPVRRRVSYIIPPPSEPVPRLRLPQHGASKTGSSAPLLIPFRHEHEQPNEPWPKWGQHPRHRLGVCCLALDTATQLVGRNTPEGILYSGGRDGMVISWDLGIPMKKRAHRYGVSDNVMQRNFGRWEIMTGWADEVAEDEDEVDEGRSDGDILGDVQDVNRRNKRRPPRPEDGIPWEEQWETDLEAFQPGQMSQFRQSVQAHTDWVNDVVLCNHNQTVVSASSDGTVKAWSPHAHSPSGPAIVGAHDDYVRCLAYCRDRQWLASASFDRTIKIWDPARTEQDALVTLNTPEASGPKASVYALAADPFGSVIASGSPERVVRMWDPRSGKRVSKLVGHTDNIRAILISEDARYLLTGSADASVKLWSLATQRCLHTFTHHADSVWSLFSNHPSLEIFYSGDRTGLVCKVDAEGCTDISEGECVLIAQESDSNALKALDGINKIVAMDDNLLWTASGSSSIKRWRVPQRRAVRAMVLGSGSDENLNFTTSPTDSPREQQSSPTLSVSRFHSPSHSPSPTPWSKSKRTSLSISDAQANKLDFEREGDETWYGLPFESLVKLTSPNEGFAGFSGVGRGRDPEVATLYSAASIMSVPRLVRSPLQAVFSGNTASNVSGPLGVPRSASPIQADSITAHSRIPEETLHPRRTARAEYEEREMASDAVPLRTIPDEVIHGEQGLVRCALLNDRVHALTVNIEGAVAVWDIVRGACLGRFIAEDVAEASFCSSTSSSHGSKYDSQDTERSPREALETVKERVEGEAVVANWASIDTKTGLLSVHLNERCFEAEIYADEAGFGPEKHFGDEARINVGKWVLRNLFIHFIRDQQRAVAKRTRETNVPENHRMHRGAAPGHIDIGSNSPEQTRLSSEAKRSPTRSKSTVVVASPNMVPAVTPSITTSTGSSPLIPPMIPINASLRDPSALSPIPQSPLSTTNTPMPRRSATVDYGVPAAMRENDYFSLRGRRPSMSAPPPVPVPPSPDDFGSWGAPATKASDSNLSTPSTPGRLMGRLKAFGKTQKKSSTDTPGAATPGTNQTTEPATPADVLQHSPPKTPLQTLFAAPLNPPSSNEAPSIPIPPHTSILISEECPSGWATLYRGQVSSTGQDARTLEEMMPFWLLEYLFVNRIPPIPTIKVSFVLLPYQSKDPNEDQLPELLNTAQSKLTASRFLRVRKLTHHVHDKLEKISNTGSRTATPRSSMDARSLASLSKQLSRTDSDLRLRPEDQFEILCNETVLPLDMTLASARQFVWKQSGELVMYYRRKKAAHEQPSVPTVGSHLTVGHPRPGQSHV